MGRPDRRRRNAIVAVMLLASWALVATSPPTEPVQRVEATDSIALRLTDGSPVNLVSFVVSASDEALWSDDPEVRPLSTIVTVQAHVPRPTPDKRSASPSTMPAPVFGVRLLRDGTEVGDPPNVGAVIPSQVEFDLRAACEEGRDCSLELQAVVEWLNPQAGDSLSAGLSITAAAAIEGPELVPVGAEISLVLEDPESPEVTVLRDGASSAPVRLDADRPMVTWSVDLSANGEANAQPLEWPIDPRAVLSLDIAVPDVAPGEYRYGDPAVRLLVIDPTAETELRPTVGSLQHELPLFRCHVVDASCEERVTLVAMWQGREPDQAVTVGWELDAGITYHAPAEPAEGAAVIVAPPSRADVHRDGPAVSATISGSIPLVDEEHPVHSRVVHIGIPADGLAEERIGGPVPAVLAVVTASTTSSRPVGDDTTIRLSAGEGSEELPLPFEPETSWVVWAAPTCRAGAACSADLGLHGTAYRPGGGDLDGTELTIHWTVEVVLLYPRGSTPPPGLEIMLTDGLP